MSFRQQRARLERAAQRQQQRQQLRNKDPAAIFPIDPEFALALREPLKELDGLPLAVALEEWKNPGGNTVFKERQRILEQQLTERIGALRCPEDYTYSELLIDEARAGFLAGQSGSGVPAVDADIELAQIAVRCFAFARSPEGIARKRIRELYFLLELSAEEQAELDQLQARYHAAPPLPWETMKEFRRALEKAIAADKEETRHRMTQRASRTHA